MFSCHPKLAILLQVLLFMQDAELHPEGRLRQSSLWKGRKGRASNLFLVSNTSTGNAEHVSYLFSRRLMFYFLEL